MAFAPRSLILFALPMRLPLPSDSLFLLFEQTFQMRVVYTFTAFYVSNEFVGYTFQMRVVYTLHRWAHHEREVGYTFQMRVVYTPRHRVHLPNVVGYTFQMRVVYTAWRSRKRLPRLDIPFK